ncbi:MAG: hypothetical protein DI538_25535 [Azospira oryzae]|nr:MAG: hypothetical protein DI538_25535 [Azospira oryzae]
MLIGEDHFTNEMPYFTSDIPSEVRFENFFCEIDPFTATILQQKINKLSPAAFQDYVLWKYLFFLRVRAGIGTT